jgi:hypothetical protein
MEYAMDKHAEIVDRRDLPQSSDGRITGEIVTYRLADGRYDVVLFVDVDGFASRELAEKFAEKLKEEYPDAKVQFTATATEDEENEYFEATCGAANAYVERETAKFVERMKRNVVKQWGDTCVTSACFWQGDDYTTEESRVHIVTKYVIMAIGGECC